jgi:hypothetical protein
MSSPITAGTRLRSQVCSTEVILVRPGAGSVSLTCGGAPMVPLDASGTAAPDPQLMTGTQLGKRYTAEADAAFEVLVTKPGDGTVGDGTTPLVVREAKPLPASD